PASIKSRKSGACAASGTPATLRSFSGNKKAARPPSTGRKIYQTFVDTPAAKMLKYFQDVNHGSQTSFPFTARTAGRRIPAPGFLMGAYRMAFGKKGGNDYGVQWICNRQIPERGRGHPAARRADQKTRILCASGQAEAV